MRLALEVSQCRIHPEQNFRRSLTRAVEVVWNKADISHSAGDCSKSLSARCFGQFTFEDSWSFTTFHSCICSTAFAVLCSVRFFQGTLLLNLTTCFITYELLFCVYSTAMFSLRYWLTLARMYSVIKVGFRCLNCSCSVHRLLNTFKCIVFCFINSRWIITW